MLAIDSGNDSPLGAAFNGLCCPVCGAANHVEKVSSIVRRNSGTIVIGGTSHPYFTGLAAALAIPPRPEGNSPARSLIWAMVSSAFALLGVLVINLLRQQNLVDIEPTY